MGLESGQHPWAWSTFGRDWPSPQTAAASTTWRGEPPPPLVVRLPGAPAARASPASVAAAALGDAADAPAKGGHTHGGAPQLRRAAVGAQTWRGDGGVSDCGGAPGNRPRRGAESDALRRRHRRNASVDGRPRRRPQRPAAAGGRLGSARSAHAPPSLPPPWRCVRLAGATAPPPPPPPPPPQRRRGAGRVRAPPPPRAPLRHPPRRRRGEPRPPPLPGAAPDALAGACPGVGRRPCRRPAVPSCSRGAAVFPLPPPHPTPPPPPGGGPMDFPPPPPPPPLPYTLPPAFAANRAGPVVVLLGGWPDVAATVWARQLRRLAAAGYRPALVELPGVAAPAAAHPTPPPRGWGADVPAVVAAYAATVRAVQAAAAAAAADADADAGGGGVTAGRADADAAVTFLVHDWGAALTWRLAAADPPLVRAVVAVDVGDGPSLPAAAFYWAAHAPLLAALFVCGGAAADAGTRAWARAVGAPRPDVAAATMNSLYFWEVWGRLRGAWRWVWGGGGGGGGGGEGGEGPPAPPRRRASVSRVVLVWDAERAAAAPLARVARWPRRPPRLWGRAPRRRALAHVRARRRRV
ncbi:hypothetical protein BU14_0192s0015 [Porphyra umbilicalis]|uniref:AB hydrolase-1 domain-containing protein n=1 Tax=Porphyra umbilicalis TaxID=2786 RepID=A0A1X6P6C4_PORUM|nr:hypothetical protein BU14_0192s0015 [Porphyra umbilicalis]|eukprot:OSX76398.1 hypothetical protein BU14_0192s0015 [Porphyra umbilicalis]